MDYLLIAFYPEKNKNPNIKVGFMLGQDALAI